MVLDSIDEKDLPVTDRIRKKHQVARSYAGQNMNNVMEQVWLKENNIKIK